MPIQDATDVADKPIAESVVDHKTPMFGAEDHVINEIRTRVWHDHGSLMVGDIGATPAGVPISRGHVTRGSTAGYEPVAAPRLHHKIRMPHETRAGRLD